jgi:deoxyguanosine kinase
MTDLIAVEGCVGAGKTTIARGLAEVRGSQLLLEDFSAVPFLEEFYANPARFAIETEFSFLLQHYHQLHSIVWSEREIIADFTLTKDLIFAELNMAGKAEQQVFADLHRLLASRVPKAAITVFVSARDELILERIRSRGRSFELAVDPEYYRRLNAAYENFFANFGGRLIRLAADQMDFCGNLELFEWLSVEINVHLGRDFAS